MTIDFNKPVKTRRGEPVTIITTTRDDYTFPVVGLVHNEKIRTYTADGKYYDSGPEHDLDLVNVTVKYEAWINIYHDEEVAPCVSSYLTKEQADCCAGTGRIACIRVEYEKGDGL